ncbi:ribosomal biogenesis factor-like [Cherax quadricarinatus]|uniref:ribosomal biogenesis factor-like n=1 Tax=Cherax quadricarinatus TaxID=27406 RepID=UPI00387ECB1C
MGKNKLQTRNPGKSGNPIYKKAGTGIPQKAKTKVKPIKTNLKQLKIVNREAIASIDNKLGSFYEAMQTKTKEKEESVKMSEPTEEQEKDEPVKIGEATEEQKEEPVKMDESSEELPKF